MSHFVTDRNNKLILMATSLEQTKITLPVGIYTYNIYGNDDTWVVSRTEKKSDKKERTYTDVYNSLYAVAQNHRELLDVAEFLGMLVAENNPSLITLFANPKNSGFPSYSDIANHYIVLSDSNTVYHTHEEALAEYRDYWLYRSAQSNGVTTISKSQINSILLDKLFHDLKLYRLSQAHSILYKHVFSASEFRTQIHALIDSKDDELNIPRKTKYAFSSEVLLPPEQFKRISLHSLLRQDYTDFYYAGEIIAQSVSPMNQVFLIESADKKQLCVLCMEDHFDDAEMINQDYMPPKGLKYGASFILDKIKNSGSSRLPLTNSIFSRYQTPEYQADAKTHFDSIFSQLLNKQGIDLKYPFEGELAYEYLQPENLSETHGRTFLGKIFHVFKRSDFDIIILNTGSFWQIVRYNKKQKVFMNLDAYDLNSQLIELFTENSHSEEDVDMLIKLIHALKDTEFGKVELVVLGQSDHVAQAV